MNYTVFTNFYSVYFNIVLYFTSTNIIDAVTNSVRMFCQKVL